MAPSTRALSALKSSAVVCTRKQMGPTVNVNIEGWSIPVRNCASFLVVVLDGRLSGGDHIDTIVTKCEKALARVWWGLHLVQLKLVSNSSVRSVTDYCSYLLKPCSNAEQTLYNPCCMYENNDRRQVLQVAQNHLLRFEDNIYLVNRFMSKVFATTKHSLLPIISQIYKFYDKCSYLIIRPGLYCISELSH